MYRYRVNLIGLTLVYGFTLSFPLPPPLYCPGLGCALGGGSDVQRVRVRG